MINSLYIILAALLLTNFFAPEPSVWLMILSFFTVGGIVYKETKDGG